ncbi:hypothetical protein G6F58_013421 [Rhizopus delemar]|nr:hypothetical protein G6F58_013421 [Rhizopus delemar]
MWRTCARYSAPASLSASWRVLRFSSRTPRCASSRLMFWPTAVALMPSVRAAAAMLPVSAVRVKLRISCNRFMTDQLAMWKPKYRLGLNKSVRLQR